MIQILKGLFWIWKQSLQSMRNMKTLVPFMLYAILQLFLLYTLVNFFNAPFSYAMIPVIKNLFGESALHYPHFYHFLPPLYNQMNLIISGIFGIMLIGTATHLFAAYFQKTTTGIRSAFSVTLKNYGVLFILWIIETLINILIIIGIPLIINNFLQIGYPASRIVQYSAFFVSIIFTSIFAYSTALVILDKQSLLKAISKTCSTFKNNALMSLLLVGIPTLIYLPINFLIEKTDLLIAKFSPEIIVIILGSGILITFFTNYIQIGTITRFYIMLSERRQN